MHKNTFFMTGGLSRGRWLGFSNVIQSFTQGRPCPSWAQEMACRVELPQSAVRKRCVRVVHQAFDSHKVNGPFSSHQSQSGYVSWDTSGDNPSIHSSARYSQIPQIQTHAYILRPGPPLGSYLRSSSGAAPASPLLPFLLAGRLNLTIYTCAYVFVFVLKASSAAHNLRACHRAWRMRAQLLHPPPTASRLARHGILRYGSGVRVEVRKNVDGAIPGTCFLAVRKSRLFVPPQCSIHRRCLAHVSGGPGREGCALDRARVEAHTSVRRWRYIFRFNRMKKNRAW